MTRREGIKPRTVNELFVVIEAVARSDALYNMLDQALAHYMRERESYNEIEACRAPFGTDKKRRWRNAKLFSLLYSATDNEAC